MRLRYLAYTAVVLTVSCVLQGCLDIHHLYYMVATSPGDKDCTLWVEVKSYPETSNEFKFTTTGGFEGHESLKKYSVQNSYYPATNFTRWEIHTDEFPGYHSTVYWTQKACVAKSPLDIELSDGDKKLVTSIPLTTLFSKPVFGSFSLLIDGSNVHLVLNENIGNTHYAYAAEKRIWSLEPAREVYNAKLESPQKQNK